MKTIKELKIGDALYIARPSGKIEKDFVQSLAGDKAIKSYNSSFTSDHDVSFDSLKDSTFFMGYYNNKVFLNQSEAIMEVKSLLCDALDKKFAEIESLHKEAIEIKNKIAEYL